ncbi:hypothetical protein SK128_018184 [Halocaridina rubra]|uniref:Uncharacterized protein n=1 Tax=Halocaridina rubra TaxID=373956 RepID=A0AAN9AG88_HALRR
MVIWHDRLGVEPILATGVLTLRIFFTHWSQSLARLGVTYLYNYDLGFALKLKIIIAFEQIEEYRDALETELPPEFQDLLNLHDNWAKCVYADRLHKRIVWVAHKQNAPMNISIFLATKIYDKMPFLTENLSNY